MAPMWLGIAKALDCHSGIAMEQTFRTSRGGGEPNFSPGAHCVILDESLSGVEGLMDDLLVEFHKNTPSSTSEIDAVEAALGIAFPSDYRVFLEMSDGGEGFIGNDYLILWRTSELQRYNRDYDVSTYAAGLLGFVSNGGGEMFAFDARFEPPPVVITPFIGMSHKDAFVVADNFAHLLLRMKRAVGSLFDAAAGISDRH